MNRRLIFAYALGPLGAAALGLAILPILAHVASQEAVGRNSIFTAAATFGILLFSLGLDQAYVREFHTGRSRSELFNACLYPGVLAFLIFSVCTLPMAAYLSGSLYGDRVWIWYLMTLLGAFAQLLTRFLTLTLRLQDQALAFSLTQVAPRLVMLVLLATCLLIGSRLSFTSLLWANLVAQSVGLLVAAMVQPPGEPRSSLLAARHWIDPTLLKFGLPLTGAALAYWGLSSSGVLALRALSEMTELGTYAMGMSFAGVATIFQAVFTTVWAPSVYKWVEGGNDPSRVTAAHAQVALAGCILLAAVGAFAGITDYILPRPYHGVKSILVCCAAQPIMYTISEATAVGIGVSRKSIYALVVAGVALLFAVALQYLLIPRYGANGAAASTALSYTAFLVARTEMAHRVWRPINRYGVYTPVLLVTTIAIWLTLSPTISSAFKAGIWSLVLVGLLGYAAPTLLRTVGLRTR